ncbi:MAG: hypothetical protein HDR02_15340 [Lachnospiraceae bacterium]|nr:hypothetical protein [Lachnospiraceae bacterium]
MNNLVIRKKGNGLLAAVLSLALAFSECLPILAQEEPAVTYEEYVSGEYMGEVDAGQYEIVRIATVEQLRELADACTYDAWSRDKRVLLTADLDLNGTELEIPVFGGIFDGQGHTISGLEIQREGSQVGLFRYLQQGAVIQELSVSEARILPQGSGCQVGILVGRNYGSIVNCQVSGVLEGEEEVGGIAGVNEESGVIRSCSAEVTVLGNRRSGGIVGSNHGTINNCANRGNINIYTNDMVYELEDFTVENLEEASSGAQLDAHMDTGGIAGFSDGKIYFCSNAGTVGYAHVGYNTGGIVGRLHQGYIQNCTNTGHVLGRKDVGGIVGQMEPFMEVEYIDGKLDELDREMDIFLDMLETSHDHLSAYGDQAMAITRQLNANLRNVSVSASNLLNITNDLWNVYNQELSGISGDFDRLSNDLRAISDKEKEEEKRQESEGGGESQEREIPEGESQDGEQSGETAAVGTDGQEQDRQALGDQLGDRLEDWREELDSVSGGDHIDWNRPGEGDDSEDWNNPLDWERPEYTQEYRDALSNFANSTSSHLHKVTDTTSQQSGQVSHNLEVFNLELKAAMDHLTELTDTLDAAQGVVDADVDALIAQARKLRRMFSDIRDELFGYEGITINDTSDEAASESIENAGVDELQQELLQEGDTVTEKWYDTASFQQGKITLCLNRGLIEADTSVGGIVGQIAIEHDLDPEDDITFTGPESLSIQESIKAVVRESRNEGRVVAKRNYVGGIAGKADFGAIVSCESYADIRSTGGSYVGGIAGRSDYTIRSCFSTGFLGGKSYVGGIAGMGSEIYYCDAMNNLEVKGEKIGAIAGDLRSEGMLYDNYYVKDSVAGIDGISYGGGAIPMDYEDFVTREGLPEEFALLTLHFVVLDEEGELKEEVETLQIPYGSGLAEEQLPKLPEKEGYYGQWPEIDYSHITESQVLAAEYTKWITALAAEEPNVAQGQAAILVEGIFYPEDVLEVTGDGEGTYCLQIHTSEGLYDRPVSVRLHQSLLPKHYEIRVLQGAGETVAESRIMGSYVVFGMEQPGSFLIAEISPEIPTRYFGLGGCVAALVLILVIRSLLRRRKTKRGGKATGQNVEAAVESQATGQNESAVQTEEHML